MAINMAVFNGDAFTAASMIEAINKRPYVPNMLDQIIKFEPVRVNTDTVWLGSENGKISLIRTTQRGAPIEMQDKLGKNLRPFGIPRLAKGDQLFAHQLANLMPWPNETETRTAIRKIDEMQTRLLDDLELTEEFHRLGALSGILLDADNSVITNYYTEFGISEPADIDLTLDNASMTIGELREKISTLVVMPIARASGSGNSPRFRINALCGDSFWFKLVGHPAVEKTYSSYAAASELREEKLWESYPLGGVTWWHYRGTDDGSTIAISTNKAKIFPVGVPGMFQHIMGPCNETFETMNQDGQRYYSFLEKDKSDKFQWVQPEVYAYPLFFNGRPDLVLTVTV
jgi:hypothetical protein